MKVVLSIFFQKAKAGCAAHVDVARAASARCFGATQILRASPGDALCESLVRLLGRAVAAGGHHVLDDFRPNLQEWLEQCRTGSCGLPG